MTLEEFKHLSWLKIDKNSYDVMFKVDRVYMQKAYPDRQDEDIMTDIQDISDKEKLYWTIVKFEGIVYINLTDSGIDIDNSYDNCIVDCLDLNNFKVPTLFISDIT